MQIKRYDNETDEQLIFRVCQLKDKIGTWSDVRDTLNDILDVNYNESTYRKQYQAFNKLLIANEQQLTNFEEHKQELENLRDELYKERCRLQDIQREKRGYLREEARFENLLEVLKDNIYNEYEVPNYKPIDNNVERKYAILQLSDWHCGAIIDNQFNYYNIDTMIERATQIRDKALSYCNIHNVTDLVIEINGDMIQGIIHVSSRVESEECATEQIITVTDILSKIILSMKPYFNSIKIVTTLGNHGRVVPKKTDSITKENFEMLIPVMLRDKLQDITVIDSKGLDFVKYNINDTVIMLSHGQNDKLNSVISDFSKIFKVVPNEVHLGHTHSYKDINDCDVKVTVNGSLMGSDDYALSIRKVTSPSQNLIIYDDDRCIYELKVN